MTQIVGLEFPEKRGSSGQDLSYYPLMDRTDQP